MATYRCWAQSGVTQRANSTVYALGARMQPAISDASTNHAVAKRYVWECTTAGTSGGAVPAWSASYTVDSSTITDGTVTWTCRAPGYSSGSTVDWTFAGIFLSYLQSLMAAGDVVLVHYTSQEAANSSAHTFSPTVNNVTVLTVDKDASEVYTPMGTSGYVSNSSSTTPMSIDPTSQKINVKGLTVRATGSGGGTAIRLGCADDCQLIGRDIYLDLNNSSSNLSALLGTPADIRSWISITNLTISRAGAAQVVRLGSFGEILGGATAGAGVVTTVFSGSGTADTTGAAWTISGFDCTGGATSSSATLFADGGVAPMRIEFQDCVLPSSYTVMSGAGNLNDSGSIVRLKNCKAGSTVGIHGYYSALGSATANTSITYNGEALSWKIDASASATRAGPFVLPWMWGQIPTGASITPKIEIARDGSTTPLTDAEVWPESKFGVTSGSPLPTFASGEAAYTSSGTNIPTGAGTGAWGGLSGTAWSGKLQTGAVTPTEDAAAMRICVATTTTIYAAWGWDT